MVREGYKETELGEIPEDWDIKYLNDISEEIGDGIHATPNYVDSSEYYFINGNNLKNNRISIFDKSLSVSEAEFNLLSKKLNENTILYSINGTIGNIAYYNNEKVVLGKSVAYIRLLKNQKKEYIFYLLTSSAIMKYFTNELTGTTIKNLSLQTLRNTPIPFPPNKLEQNRIATVLSTLDECIEKTEALIVKLKQVKTGLMQDLLTRGIDDEGRIRDESTHEFKDTEIGRVPVEWEIKKLKEIAESFKNGIYKEEKFYGTGYPSVRMYNIHEGIINIKNSPLLYVTNKELKEYGLLENDILINRVNSPELVGKNGIVPSGLGLITFESKNIRIRVNNEISDPSFINRYLLYENGAKQVKAGIKPAISQSTINQIDLGKVMIPIPNLKEQYKICQIIDSLLNRLIAEENYLNKLTVQKKGIMTDLLTGRIRVPADITETLMHE